MSTILMKKQFIQNFDPFSVEQTENLLKIGDSVHTKARKPFWRGVHPWRKYDCEYSQPFNEGEASFEYRGKSITL